MVKNNENNSLLLDVQEMTRKHGLKQFKNLLKEVEKNKGNTPLTVHNRTLEAVLDFFTNTGIIEDIDAFFAAVELTLAGNPIKKGEKNDTTS